MPMQGARIRSTSAARYTVSPDMEGRALAGEVGFVGVGRAGGLEGVPSTGVPLGGAPVPGCCTSNGTFSRPFGSGEGDSIPVPGSRTGLFCSGGATNWARRNGINASHLLFEIAGDYGVHPQCLRASGNSQPKCSSCFLDCVHRHRRVPGCLSKSFGFFLLQQRWALS